MVERAAELDAARQAAKRYSWSEAFERFGAADAQEPLEPDDLDTMASCAWWLGKMRHCIALRERAYNAYLKEGNARRAARIAIHLSDHHQDLLEPSTGSAWLQRATRALADEPEGAEHAWLKLGQALALRHEGEVKTSTALAAEAREIGARHGDKDVFALGLAIQGTGKVFSDEDVETGLAMTEEATVGAVSGELGPIATGWIYCMAITISAHLADWQRAGRWTDAAKRWCDRQAINGFPGVCRVHRAEIMRLRGSLFAAEEEARTATDELGSFNLYFAAQAFRELGDIRLRMGDINGAEEAYRQAEEMGVTPQPGMALVQMQRGQAQAAASSLRRALSDQRAGPMERVKLLPTQVDVALALDDLDTARRATAELDTIAGSYSSPALRATVDAATAALRLAEGDPASARRAAGEACRLFTQTELIYDAARVSLLLGRIDLAAGEIDDARSALSSALSTFERIGAVPDAVQARALLGTVPGSDAHGRSVTRTFLSCETGRSTTESAGRGDETVRKLFAEHGGEEVARAGDRFFVAFGTPDGAIACATAIQRSLASDDWDDAVASQVRVGVHATEATYVQGNYLGKGVHEAARIAELAEDGEIVASVETVGAADARIATTNERTVSLSGVDEPVAVITVAWRGADLAAKT